MDCNKSIEARSSDFQLWTLDLKQKLEREASTDAGQEISQVLDQINQLSDKDKVLLYLNLPIGHTVWRSLSTSNNLTEMFRASKVQRLKVEAQQWLRANYTESQSSSVSRQEVYDHYRKCCELAGVKALNQQDFGKVVKHVFCSVTYRRLGNRSNSKYPFIVTSFSAINSSIH
jgi:hypothetical protein